MKKQNITQIPIAQLWIGRHSHLVAKTKEKLQKIFCEKNSCKTCATCQLIEKEQHHGSIWLKPEKQYTRDQIQVIFNTISFKLDTDKKLFFIVQNADFLTDACSNSLLKSVEEPPTGYHFIFLAERQSQILPTIQSRCIIKSFYQDDHTYNQNKIIHIFTSQNSCPPDEFLKTLDAQKPNEKDTVEMIDTLFGHWLRESKSALQSKNPIQYKIAMSKISKLKRALKYSPMPGSSKIFWRNFYLQFN